MLSENVLNDILGMYSRCYLYLMNVLITLRENIVRILQITLNLDQNKVSRMGTFK